MRKANASPSSPAKTTTRPGRPGVIDYGLLALLASMWGASFLLIKIGVAEVAPFTLTAARLGCAAILLSLVLLARGLRLPSDGRAWTLAAIVATLGTALPFTLISWGQQHIASGVTAIIMGVMPLTTMLLAHVFVPDDKLTAPKVIGVAFGFAGVGALVGPAAISTLGDALLGQLAIATAATCYGASAVVTRRMMHDTPPIALATSVMLIAFAVMLPAALFIEGLPERWPSPPVLAAIGILGIFQTGIARLILFALVARQGPSFFSQINFIVPVVGVFWGAALLGERLDQSAWFALAAILAGLALARRRG